MKGFMRRGLACLLAVLLLCAGGTALAAPDMDVMRDGMVIVAVTGRVPSGEQASDWSTGFIVGPSNGPARYILTSRDMMDAFKSIDDITVFSNNIYKEEVPVTHYDRAREGPFALINVAEQSAKENTPPKKALPMKRMKTVKMGDTLYMLGMKPNAEGRIEAVRYPCVAEKIGQNDQGYPVLFISTNEFYSELYGGPIVTEDGYVVGVTDFFTERLEGKSAATYTAFLDIATVMDYFDSQEMVYYSDTDAGILAEDGLTSFDIPRGSQPVGSGGTDISEAENTAEPVDPSKPENTAAPVTPDDPVDQEPEKQNDVVLYVIIGIVVLAAAGGGFYLMRKKSKPAPGENYHTEAQVAAANVPAAHKEAPQPKARASGIWLHCIAGPLEGQKFNLEPVTVIGRDPKRAKIMFEDNTKGISGVHCELKISGGVIQLTDLGSSYGTYLADGTKLTAKQPYTLKKGDAFYLGSKQVGFSIQ